MLIRHCAGKRKHTPPCSSPGPFFAEKNGVHRGKISVVDMVFLGFLYPPPAWKVFLWGQKSSPKDFLSVVVVYVFFFSVVIRDECAGLKTSHGALRCWLCLPQWLKSTPVRISRKVPWRSCCLFVQRTSLATLLKRPRRIPWAQVPSNKSRATYGHKRQKKTKYLNFRPREAREFLGKWDKNSKTVKTQKFDISGDGLREDKNSRTQIPDNNSNFWNLRP